MGPVVGIDIGGTAIKAGILGPQGDSRAAEPIPTQVERGAQDLCDRLANLVRELGAQAPIGLGVRVPAA